ncbi:dihydrolipoamide acetyltransferase family protein [Actinotalea sp. Marseille-Q4924]|uniref:dihydrolipoamide acetyltransferase family protein n=1 Tax=Actinotalea sp. Marseille-Q4924 TaxID=2866571 RepID=UPI001CE3DD98|nr:dihydrolipoamide acetyltransferase family protein [Actinotalea sp. Marseille-Q4924]
MAVEEFAMPDLGEGLTEAELVSWQVAEGDTVELNQTIAEVETAKALVQVPSPFEGTVARLHVEEGTTVSVGTTILSVRTSADDDAPAADDAAGSTTDAPAAPTGPGADGAPAAGDADQSGAPARTAVLVGYGPPVEGGARPRRRERAASWSARHGGAAALAGGRHPGGAGGQTRVGAVHALSGERPRSYPPVRKLAHDLGVDLAGVVGTGPAGLVTREDVLASTRGTDRTDAGAPSSAPAGPREERIPVTGVRKHTAAAMVASAFTAPHATEFLTVDVTATSELLARLAADRRLAGHRIGVLAFVAKAMTVALRAHPTLNARWDEAAGEIVQYRYVNLGIAAATPRGLVVPNVKDADRMDLVELADALRDLAERARAGATPPAEMSGGTISITNIGVFGIDAGTPILVPGEAAILALGAVRRRPWEHHGEVALRDVMTLSLSFDHRLVDGEQASRFLRDLGDVLADPGRLVTLV